MKSEATRLRKQFPVPDWAWNARVAVFPGMDIDAGKKELLDIEDSYIDDACERFAKRGVTLIQAAGFHARMLWIPYLEKLTDLNRRIVKAAHEHGMKVFDHHTCNGMWNHVTDKLYGWCPDESTCVDIRFDRRYVPDQGKFCCLNNAEFRKHYYHYITDYVKQTGVDGLMCDDMLFYYGQYGCGCEHCRSRFRRVLGYDMPSVGEWPLDDYSNPVWRDWMRFRMDSIREFKNELHLHMPPDFLLFTDSSGVVLDIDDCHHAGQSPEALAAAGDTCLICESGGFSYREPKMHPLAYTNYQSWEHMYVSRKYMQAVARHYQVPFIQHHYPATPEDGWFCWALNKVTGMQYWRDDAWHYGGPRYADEFTEWTPELDYLKWEAEHEFLWNQNQAVADVGLLFSAQTKLNSGADNQPHGEAFAGWAQTLQQEGIFFHALIDSDLEDAGALAPLKVLILPNAVSLSEKQVMTIQKFVRNGGNVIATHLSSAKDETGFELGDFALADLFGVQRNDKSTTLRSAWLLDQRERNSAFGDGLPARIPFQPVAAINWNGESETSKALAWAERVQVSFDWPTMPATVKTTFGKGRVIYHLPAIGQLAYREGAYPLWNRAPEKEQYILKEEEKGVRCCFIHHETPENAEFQWVDESHEGARQLIVNSINHMLPRSRFSLEGLPEGVLADVHGIDSNDESGIVLCLLNVCGMAFKHGDNIVAGAKPVYPSLSGEALLTLEDFAVEMVTMYSPDLKEPVVLDFTRKEEGINVSIPVEKMNRVAFIYLKRK